MKAEDEMMNGAKELRYYYEELATPKSYKNFEKKYYDFLTKVEENNVDYKKSEGFYIDPDGVTEFYNHLTCFLNHQEKKYKKSYLFMPPKAAPLTTTKITVIQNGEMLFRLTSDQFGFSADKRIYKYNNDKYNYYKCYYGKYPLANLLFLTQGEDQTKREEIKKQIARYVKNTRTIGGSFLWPVPPKGRCNCIYNTSRGIGSYLEDRVDLTLLEIKHALDGSYDKGEHTSDILYRQYQNGKRYIKEWLKHFDSFDSYVEYFMLEDFVEKKDGKYVPINIINGEPLNDDYLKKYREQYKKSSLQNLTEKEIRAMLEYLEKKILERSAKMENIIKLYYEENHG